MNPVRLRHPAGRKVFRLEYFSPFPITTYSERCSGALVLHVHPSNWSSKLRLKTGDGLRPDPPSHLRVSSNLHPCYTCESARHATVRARQSRTPPRTRASRVTEPRRVLGIWSPAASPRNRYQLPGRKPLTVPSFVRIEAGVTPRCVGSSGAAVPCRSSKCLFVQWLVLTLMCLQTMWSWVLQVFTEARNVCVCARECARVCQTYGLPPHILFLARA